MKKTNNTTGRKATKRAANAAKTTTSKTATTATAHTDGQAQREQARIARWAEQIDANLRKIGESRSEDFDLIRAAANVAGMSPDEFILDAMKREHGLTAKPTVEAQCTKRTDEDFDGAPIRARNNHDREAVQKECFCYSHISAAALTPTEKVEVVRLFFKPGDRSLAQAEARAIRAAIRATIRKA